MGLMACAQTPCGEAYMEWKALKELNMKGIYPPNQIQKAEEEQWKSVVGKGDSTCNKEQAQEICTSVVNSLGESGNGIKFDQASFETQYDKIDMLGLGTILEAQVIVIITCMMAPSDKEDD